MGMSVTINGQLVQSIGISAPAFARENVAHITLLGQESCMLHVLPYIPPCLTCYRCCAKHVKCHIVFNCFCVSLTSKGLNRERTSTLFYSYHTLLDIMPLKRKRQRQMLKNRRWKKQKIDNQESSACNQDQVSESSVIKSNDSKDKDCKSCKCECSL